MKALARASWILFRTNLVRTLRTRRGLIAAGLAAFPVAIAFVLQQASRHFEATEGPAPVEPVIVIAWGLLVQVIVPLIALVLASGVIAEEIEDRTITYLFTRPIPRSAILLGRWLAAALPILVFAGISAEVVIALLGDVGSRSGGPYLPEGFHWRVLGTVLMGGTVYSAVFAAAGALFKRPMLVGIAYTFVYEGFLGTLPGANQNATVIFYLKSFLFAGYPAMLGEAEDAVLSQPLVEPAAAVRSLVVILVGVLALGAWRFSKREYVLAA